MNKNKIIISIGALVALMPFLGFPNTWEATFQVLAGLSIVLLSVLVTLDKRISQKTKARMRALRKKEMQEKEAQDKVPGDSIFSPNFSDDQSVLDTSRLA